jgi:hypothetical protein
MTNRDLLKEAIADARAVKETAIANAKAALEEAFTPHLKSMLAAKLEELEKDEDIEEAKYSKEDDDMMEEVEVNEEKDEIEEEFDLNEILAELEEGEDKEEMSKKVAKKAKIKEEDDDDDEDDDEWEDWEYDDDDPFDDEYFATKTNEAEEAEGEMEDEEIDLEDMTEADLKSFIEDVIADMVSAGELEAGEEMEAGEDEIGDMEGMEELDEMDEVSWNEKNNPTRGANGEKDPQKVGQTTSAYAINEDDLREALKQIAELKKELHEVNLLNAKLLYTNKIFKAKNLNEEQKVKVLKAFDKVTTVKEAKLIFETLNEGMVAKSSKTSMISEIKGSASKATGLIKENKQPIVEVDPMVARWQKLAGIK